MKTHIKFCTLSLVLLSLSIELTAGDWLDRGFMSAVGVFCKSNINLQMCKSRRKSLETALKERDMVSTNTRDGGMRRGDVKKDICCHFWAYWTCVSKQMMNGACPPPAFNAANRFFQSRFYNSDRNCKDYQDGSMTCMVHVMPWWAWGGLGVFLTGFAMCCLGKR